MKSLKLPNHWSGGQLQTEGNWNIARINIIGILNNFHQLNELQISNDISILNCDILSFVLSKLPKLKKLIVIVDDNRDTFHFGNNFEHLEWLELRVLPRAKCVQAPLNTFLIVDISIHCQNLTTFVINGAKNIKNKDFEEGLAHYINSRLTKLRCFKIKNCRNITKEYFEETFPDIGIFEE